MGAPATESIWKAPAAAGRFPVQDSDDKAYYIGRAKVARALAEAATDPVVREIHLRMADSYEQLVATSAPLRLAPPPG